MITLTWFAQKNPLVLFVCLSAKVNMLTQRCNLICHSSRRQHSCDVEHHHSHKTKIWADTKPSCWLLRVDAFLVLVKDISETIIKHFLSACPKSKANYERLNGFNPLAEYHFSWQLGLTAPWKAHRRTDCVLRSSASTLPLLTLANCFGDFFFLSADECEECLWSIFCMSSWDCFHKKKKLQWSFILALKRNNGYGFLTSYLLLPVHCYVDAKPFDEDVMWAVGHLVLASNYRVHPSSKQQSVSSNTACSYYSDSRDDQPTRTNYLHCQQTTKKCL